jgi:putative DNA-invertase from lambdoid prophage Rac
MILGYVRVSSADQAKDDRSSLQTQTDVIEGIARLRGANKWDLQIYTDAGVSGAVKLAFRPGGEQLLADMKEGDVVVASKLDRMFRSASDALSMLEEFKARKVHLILYDMGAEPITGGGVAQLVFTILAAVAEMERGRIKERTAEGRKAKKARGGPVGEVPFGFRKVGEGRSALLEPNEKELAAVARMKVLARTASLRQIGARLAEEGFVSRAGTPYSPAVIARVTNAV